MHRRTAVFAMIATLACGALPLASGAAAAQDAAGDPTQGGQTPAQIAAIKRQVFDDPAAPVIGDPAAKVTLVEFSDYNCGYCRKALPEVTAFLQANPDVKLVIHETPIFGEGSRYAAMAALAAQKQGKYPQFHRAMMSMRGKAEKASVLRVARDVGLDTARLERDIAAPEVTAQIEATLALADTIGLVGTPSFIAGDRASFGYLTRSELAELVDEARGKAD